MSNMTTRRRHEMDLLQNVRSYSTLQPVSHDPGVRDHLNTYRDSHPARPTLQGIHNCDVRDSGTRATTRYSNREQEMQAHVPRPGARIVNRRCRHTWCYMKLLPIQDVSNWCNDIFIKLRECLIPRTSERPSCSVLINLFRAVKTSA